MVPFYEICWLDLFHDMKKLQGDTVKFYDKISNIYIMIIVTKTVMIEYYNRLYFKELIENIYLEAR